MTATLDDILSFDPTGGTGGANPYVEDGYFWASLVDISMPYMRPDFNDPSIQVAKVDFIFEITGTYDKKTGEVIESEFDTQQLKLEVKADANGPKSTKYSIASALLGQDLAAYTGANGPVKPSLLIGLSCWIKVVNEVNKKDSTKSYTKIKWDGFTAQLPAHLIRPVVGQGQAPNRQAPNAMVGRAAPARPATPAGQSPF
jgi:hypothetical protein